MGVILKFLLRYCFVQWVQYMILRDHLQQFILNPHIALMGEYSIVGVLNVGRDAAALDRLFQS